MACSAAGSRGAGGIIVVWVGLIASIACVGCEQAKLYPMRRNTLLVDAAVDSGPPLLQLDGEPCNDDAVCEGGHCNNRVCCASGECCRNADDCSDNDQPGVCIDPTSCSGMKPIPMCDHNQCKLKMGEDDTACDETVEASSCDLYKSEFCTGKTKQSEPECPVSCENDDACDPGTHCEGGDCLPNAASGVQCTADSECQTGRCINGYCCDSENCCMVDSDCDSARYSKAPTCDDPATCQGSAGTAVCQNGRCGTTPVDDDSACSDMILANDCMAGGKVYCRGGRDQSTPPGCASGMCSRDLDCSRTAYCLEAASLFESAMCTPDLPNGGRCTRGEMCQSGHCSGSGGGPGVCCSYDCCDSTARCPDVDCSMMMDACGN